MKKLISTIGVLFLLISINAQNAEMDPEAAKAYNEGNKMLKAGNYNGAVEKYDAALQTSEDYRIYYQKGVALKKLRKFDEAIQAYQSALESNPNFGASYNGLGGIYYSQGQYQKAAEQFVQFKNSTDKDSHKRTADKYISLSYTKLGVEAKQNGDYRSAENHLLRAVENYNYDAAYLALAETYVETAQFEKALRAADNAINHRDKISRGAPYYYKGRAFQELNDNQKAIENYKIAVQDAQYRDLSNHYLNELQ